VYSQNGWPVLEAGDKHLHRWVLPGTERAFTLRDGSAGFLLMHLALFLDEKVEPIDREKVWDDWGWAVRPIRGQSTGYSNHAAGCAIDYNAAKHPLGTTGNWTPKQVKAIHDRLKMYKGTIRWGADYTGRKDPMHFEINADLAACERVARKLIDTPRGKRILDANPGQRQVVLS
jgi:hypothetical protein